MPRKTRIAHGRSRRLTFTCVCDDTDPIERLLIQIYDTLPKLGHRRQDFLRRTLLAGMTSQMLAAEPDQAQRLIALYVPVPGAPARP